MPTLAFPAGAPTGNRAENGDFRWRARSPGKQDDLIAIVPGDRFLKKICKDAIKAGRDKSNPIRGNLVASALRELASHVLHSLAPDDEVRHCVWFKQAKDTKTITRGQRALYHSGRIAR